MASGTTQSIVAYAGAVRRFYICVKPDQLSLWRDDTTIPLSKVVPSSTIFVFPESGAIANNEIASETSIHFEFGSQPLEDTIKRIMENGTLVHARETANDPAGGFPDASLPVLPPQSHTRETANDPAGGFPDASLPVLHPQSHTPVPFRSPLPPPGFGLTRRKTALHNVREAISLARGLPAPLDSIAEWLTLFESLEKERRWLSKNARTIIGAWREQLATIGPEDPQTVADTADVLEKLRKCQIRLIAHRGHRFAARAQPYVEPILRTGTSVGNIVVRLAADDEETVGCATISPERSM